MTESDSPARSTEDPNTGTFAYGEHYYATYDTAPYEHSELWSATFGNFAEGIVSRFRPRTVLDVGCAKGFMVEALRERGVDAWGIDVSSYAISAVAPQVAPYVAVSSATESLPENFPQHFDLVISLECLEHIDPAQCPRALDHLTSWSNDILFSSCPSDFAEASHVNTRALEDWVSDFAARGFLRNFAIDTSFVMKWAFAVRRSEDATRHEEIVRRYERSLWHEHQNHLGAREVLAELTGQLEEIAAELKTYTDDDQSVTRAENIALHEELAAVYASPQWRAGGRLLALPRALRRARKTPSS